VYRGDADRAGDIIDRIRDHTKKRLRLNKSIGSAGRSSMPMGAGCGQRRMNLAATYFNSPCPT